MKKKTPGPEPLYGLLEIFQFIAALLVILIHCGRLSSNPYSHFILKSLLCRIAVPFYFVCSGYFYRQKTEEQVNYSKKYGRRQIRQYLKWSLLYLPFGFYFLIQKGVTFPLIPVGLAAALVYTGVWYHLWYIPALLTGLFLVRKVKERMGYLAAFVLFGLLFLIGSAETYSTFIQSTVAGNLYAMYRSFFFTTRNGLFFSPIFILCGFFLSDYKNHALFVSHSGKGLVFSVLLLLFEGWLFYPKQGDDKNFLFALIPVALFLMAYSLQKQIERRGRAIVSLRSINKSLYFLHPLFLELILYLTSHTRTGRAEGFSLFFATLGSTCLFILFRDWITAKRRNSIEKIELSA